MAKAIQYAFGENPINLIDQGDTYAISAQDAATLEVCGVTPEFPKERLAIMQARAYAHGYALVLPDSEPTPPAASTLTPELIQEWVKEAA